MASLARHSAPSADRAFPGVRISRSRHFAPLVEQPRCGQMWCGSAKCRGRWTASTTRSAAATCSSRSGRAAPSIRRPASSPRRGPRERYRRAQPRTFGRRGPFRRSLLWPGHRNRPGFCGSAAARLAHKMRDDLDVGREQELIDGHDTADSVAAIDEDAKVARERA